MEKTANIMGKVEDDEYRSHGGASAFSFLFAHR
jgi:hypothetical protein